jgi:uncharacterized protein (DUF1778 family)
VKLGTGRTARLNMRLTPLALHLIQEAAAAQNQNVTTFVLDAALERARTVLTPHHELHPWGWGRHVMRGGL